MVFDEIIHSDQGSTKVYAEEDEQIITLEKMKSCPEKQPIDSAIQSVEIMQQEELPKELSIPRDLSVENIIGQIQKNVSIRSTVSNYCEHDFCLTS